MTEPCSPFAHLMFGRCHACGQPLPAPDHRTDAQRACRHARIHIACTYGWLDQRGCLDCDLWIDPVRISGEPLSKSGHSLASTPYSHRRRVDAFVEHGPDLPDVDTATLDSVRVYARDAWLREAARDELNERRWRADRWIPPEGGCPHVP